MLTAYKDCSAKRSEIEKDAIQDSLVKRFEYTLEVSWKTTKRYLNEEGFLEAATGSPKSIIRLAAQAGIIQNAENWISYINARQSTSHDYSDQKAEMVLEITDDFYKDVTALYESLSKKR